MVQVDYRKLLQAKEWKEKRLIILSRDGYQCTCCHRTERKLYVHHRYYKANNKGEKFLPWEYPDDALVSLCYACHRHVHDTTRIVVKYCIN